MLKQPIVDMSLPYGEKPDLAKIEEILSSGAADAVAVVYGGTSTCTLNPGAGDRQAQQRSMERSSSSTA